DWTLEFEFDREIKEIWNGVITEHVGNQYVVTNAGYNANINPGENITVGFLVSEGSSEKSAMNFSLTSFSLNQEQMGEEQEREPLKDLTESYIKPATEDDIIFDENEGIYYVKNQVMVGAYLGTPKVAIEKIAEEIGAEIVGYVELIEDYQFEFKQTMTYSELMDMVNYLEGIPYVDYAELNLAAPCKEQYFSNDELYLTDELWKTSSADSNNDGVYEDTEMQNTKTPNANDGWKKFTADGNNWGLEALNVHGAWDYKDSYQGPVKVGIYDNMFGENDDLVFDDCIGNPRKIDKVHGTHVAGTIGATFDNGIGISGVATDVKLYGYSVANTLASDGQIFAKLIENDVRVINVSYGYFDEITYAASVNDSTGDKARKMIRREAESLSKKLKKLIVQGYDFLIINSAGNGNGRSYVKDSREPYGYAIYNPEDPQHTNETPDVGHPKPCYSSKLAAITEEIVASRIMVVGAVEHSMNGYKTEYSIASFSQEGNRVDVYAPGVDILSTVPKSGFCDSYMTLSGTSMAAPHISGLAALILQANPELTALQVKDIIKDKDNYGAQIGMTGKYMPDAEKCIVAALNMPGGGGFDTSLPHGTLKGKTVNSSGKELEGLIVSVVRISTGQSNLGDYYFTTETKSDGSFEIELPQGTYEMVIYGETFYDGAVMPFKTSNIVIEPETEKYLETTVLFLSLADELWECCNISGIVYDALSGEPVEGATINVRAGWNTFNGPYVTGVFNSSKEDISDVNGVFNIKAVYVGQYTVEIKKDGYVIGYYNMIS
ncbi:MAG: S8 family serine peptidase, partial [Lachnospiraceae bacterium]